MVRRLNPIPDTMTQGYPQRFQPDDGQPPAYNESFQSAEMREREMNDDYYGRAPTVPQQAPYGQPYPGQYGDAPDTAQYQYTGPSAPPPASYPPYTSPPEAGRSYVPYDPNKPYPSGDPAQDAPMPAYGSGVYNPSGTAPHLPTSKPDGTPVGPEAGDPDQRGLAGALAGAAAGGFAGHKVHHGVLGTLGGAYAGHKLEEAYKHHHAQQQAALHAAPPVPPGHPNQQQQQQHFRGNFSSSSRNISLDRDFDLIAEAATVNGQHRMSSVNLNACLTNDNGAFAWRRDGNFAASARQVHLSPDGKELRAELRTVDGRWVRSAVRLDERIENSDGNLQVVW